MDVGQPICYLSSPLNKDLSARVAEDITLILQNGDLEKVVRLHAQSLDRSIDNLRAFISAWSALEILLGNIFPFYQEMLSAEIGKVSASPGFKSYLARITKIMKDKHNIKDKFAIISMFLDEEQNNSDIEIFRKVKKIRDRLSHGEQIPDEILPTKDVQRLFEKYFRNHIRRRI